MDFTKRWKKKVDDNCTNLVRVVLKQQLYGHLPPMKIGGPCVIKVKVLDCSVELQSRYYIHF